MKTKTSLQKCYLSKLKLLLNQPRQAFLAKSLLSVFQHEHDLAPRQRRASRLGFTLLELLVVLVLIAIIVAGVAISFRGPVLAAQLSTTISSLKSLDQRTRYAASLRKERQLIVLDLETGKLETSQGTDSLELPASIRIKKVFVSQQKVESQKLSLPYFPDGSSASWAVQISNGVSSQWVLFAGQSGQVHVAEGEDDIAEVFELLAKRPDAN